MDEELTWPPKTFDELRRIETAAKEQQTLDGIYSRLYKAEAHIMNLESMVNACVQQVNALAQNQKLIVDVLTEHSEPHAEEVKITCPGCGVGEGWEHKADCPLRAANRHYLPFDWNPQEDKAPPTISMTRGTFTVEKMIPANEVTIE